MGVTERELCPEAGNVTAPRGSCQQLLKHVLNRKTRTISVRLSDEEYDELRNVTQASGARSISDYMRAQVFDSLACNKSVCRGEFDARIGRLTSEMQNLSMRFDRLCALIGPEEKP